MISIQESGSGVTFAANIHPRARKEFFAKLLKVPRSSVTIASGLTGRNKVIRIKDLSAQELRKLLATSQQIKP